MDIISFNEAATANGRIEKFINNPDSNSGIVTVPKVIGAGESVTVPAGRVAVLPNVQVDGVLNVDGEVFIPSGAGLSTVVQKSGDTMTGNLNFASGTKITGDFSNADRTQRASVQSSTANSVTVLQTIPNGSGVAAYNVCFGSSDIINSTSLTIGASMASAEINANKVGAASYPPMTFFTGDLERMRIDTAGNIGIGTSTPNDNVSSNRTTVSIKGRGTLSNDGCGIVQLQTNSAGDTLPLLGNIEWLAKDNINSIVNRCSFISSSLEGTTSGNRGSNLTIGTKKDGVSGTGVNALYIDASQNVLAVSGGLGYGPGAGGTVTQLTSKSTAVTLNKPSGRITMNNSSLASGATVIFQVNNSLVTTNDTVSVIAIDNDHYDVTTGWNTNGAFTIRVKNITAGALADALNIQFLVCKGAVA